MMKIPTLHFLLPVFVLCRLPDINFPKDAVPRIPSSVLAGKHELWSTAGFHYFKLVESGTRTGPSFVAYGVDTIRFENLKNRDDTTIEWSARPEDAENCKFDEENPDEICRNHINIVERWNKRGHFLVCGTNARKPKCRIYDLSSDEPLADIQAKAMETEMDAPMTQAEPGKSIKVEFVKNSVKKNFMFFAKELEKGGALSRTTPSGDSFSAEGFLALKDGALSSFGSVRFIKMIDLEEHVMIFFTEVLSDGETASRVATICKNDDGGSLSVLTKKFTTFIKTTLSCPVKDDFSFR